MSPYFSLASKIAVITGAASGIGLETATRFRSAGAEVILADLADASHAADDLNGMYIRTDVSNHDQVDALVGAAIERYGRLDVMVNNAGILEEGSTLHYDEDRFRRTWAVNVEGVMHGMRAAGRVMKPNSVIVNTASMAGIVGFPHASVYGASKHAVVGLTKNAAIDLGPAGIRVNCVCPTGVDTPMVADDDPGDPHWATRALRLANQHRNTLATASEVAAAIHFLASDDAAMVNGHALWVDGGLGAGLSIDLIEQAVGVDLSSD